MHKLVFECETITPMFLAGADGKTPELRAPSIKGALRFWWRAMNGNKSIEKLKIEEANIFGGTETVQGKSKVIIRTKGTLRSIKEKLPNHSVDVYINTKKKNIKINILEYLAYEIGRAHV